MMKKHVFCILSSLVVCSVCHAAVSDVFFKMEAPVTDLLPGQTVTVTLSAWANDPAATGTNGLNGWGLSALVDTTGVVEVVSGSVNWIAPSPWSVNASDTGWDSINSALTGGTGSIQYLRLLANVIGQDSGTGVGDYSPIVEFDIQAIGNVNDSVTYTLADDGAGFGGFLADFTDLPGQFDADQSQTVFTIVPEPATLLILGLGAVAVFRRKR